MNPTLQILLATYDSSRYLSEQLESILAQDFQDFEILINDGGSTDGTLELIESYRRKFPGKIVFLGSARASAMANFATLMTRSEAGLVMFSDHDDVWKPGKISRTLEKYREMSSLSGARTPIMVFTDSEVTDGALNVLSPSLMRYSRLDPCCLSLNRLLAQNVASGNTMLLNRALLELALPIPPEAVMHDHWITLAAAALGRIGFLNEATLYYRQHDDNIFGAFPYSPFPLLKKLQMGRDKLRERFDRNILQAAAFGRRYADRLAPADREMLAALENWPSLGFFARRQLLLRHRICKSGFLRNLGMFLLT